MGVAALTRGGDNPPRQGGHTCIRLDAGFQVMPVSLNMPIGSRGGSGSAGYRLGLPLCGLASTHHNHEISAEAIHAVRPWVQWGSLRRIKEGSMDKAPARVRLRRYPPGIPSGCGRVAVLWHHTMVVTLFSCCWVSGTNTTTTLCIPANPHHHPAQHAAQDPKIPSTLVGRSDRLLSFDIKEPHSFWLSLLPILSHLPRSEALGSVSRVGQKYQWIATLSPPRIDRKWVEVRWTRRQRKGFGGRGVIRMILLDGQPLPPGRTIRVVAAAEKVVAARGTKRVVSRTKPRTATNRAAAEEASDADIWVKYIRL
ncbi:hypothetical protein B0H67DRAFT_114524 [Lasiosphaeris hirsuta]|uniref:Uncharacterized protein n=1 Tax=Lasiosphaeris hirsuta TaxID=260670 RepID=A0AA40AZE8_9PEZI|nr:hypothetical protein B0H67DRAFT_114524 [Lasiosphaeris hirsuta]